ncbi:hypothetical protein ACVIIV_001905 [Bradyrhizobium sp. USDA 4354]
MQLLRLFVSSTFRDMETERNILARLVFPHMRKLLSARAASLQEVDLRWGVTRAMSSDSGAVAICLRELASCFPLVLGMVGRRSGWTPPREALSAFDAAFAATMQPTASMTEIELRYASNLASRNAEPHFPIMIRSDSLSSSVGIDETEWMASERLRNWALGSSVVRAIEYRSFDEFERLVDAELEQILSAHVGRTPSQNVAATSLPELARYRDFAELSRAASGGRPLLVNSEQGTGTSWLLRRWINEDPTGLYIDGRVVSAADLVKTLGGASATNNAPSVGRDIAGIQGDGFSDSLTSHLLSRLTRDPATRRIVLDHFDDAIPHEARSEISWIPSYLPRGCGVIVVTRNRRLQKQAADLGWRRHDIGPISRDEAVDFAERYLGAFSKQLERQQITALKSATWATHLASLVLALDELRRHGTFETLDLRLAELVACSSGAALAQELISGLTSAMPPEWQRSVEDSVFAIRMSLKGLEESEIRATVGASATAANLLASEAPLPSHLWSAIRICLASALSTRGPLIDLSGGALLEWVDQRFLVDQARIKVTAAGLRAALENEPPLRRWTEAPQLAQVSGGMAGLEDFLSDPENIRMLANVGETFAEGWLLRLTPLSRQRVVAEWDGRLAASARPEAAWQLGLMAARCGQTDAGLRLMELGTEQDHNPSSSRGHKSLLAFLKRDGAYLDQLARRLATVQAATDADAAADITEGISILAAYADGVVKLDRSVERALLSRLTQNIRRHGNALLEAQLRIFSGQILLNHAKWFCAARSFTSAEKILRRLGHARLLCQTLERISAVQLERNKFRSSRRAAAECRDLAFRAGLPIFEALAFERQIEVERRRANWAVAYELVTAFRARCREGLCDMHRADSALATLEATDDLRRPSQW